MRWYFILGLLIGTAWDCSQKAPAPPKDDGTPVIEAMNWKKVGPANGVNLLYDCPLTGSCRLILKWTKPSNFVATSDSFRVKWTQNTPAPVAVLKNVIRTRGTASAATADTIMIDRPDSVGKTGVVVLCYYRLGWVGQACNANIAWEVKLPPVIPPDTASGLILAGVIVKPDQVTMDFSKKGIYKNTSGQLVDSVGKLLNYTCPSAGSKCPQQQFCGYGRMGDFTIGMLEPTDTNTYCRGIYDNLPNHRPTYAPVQVARLPDGTFPEVGIHINADGEGHVSATAVSFGKMRLALASNGEWINPDLLPIAVAMH